MAEIEIQISEPYFKILSDIKTTKRLRSLLIKQAPKEFYSILTQTVRHLLNNTFCSENPKFCKTFENTLYILALPSTSLKIKQNILLLESPLFIKELFQALIKALKK
jgi:hypothetical protein